MGVILTAQFAHRMDGKQKKRSHTTVQCALQILYLLTEPSYCIPDKTFANITHMSHTNGQVHSCWRLYLQITELHYIEEVNVEAHRFWLSSYSGL